jgi:uncharacterized protein YutE (UPF0331/DUF86 family)
MINYDLIEARLALISTYIGRLETIAKLGVAEFAADHLRTAAAESYLRRALDAAFGIGRHLLAKAGHADLAAEYKAIARGMVAIGAVGAELSGPLVQMAGYRNRLVHLYNEVAAEELHSILTQNLKDLRRFVKDIQAYCDRTRRS